MLFHPTCDLNQPFPPTPLQGSSPGNGGGGRGEGVEVGGGRVE